MPRFNIQIKKLQLKFKNPAGTSRGVLSIKDTCLLKLTDSITGKTGIGEINMFAGLSSDDNALFYPKLEHLIKNPDYYLQQVHSTLSAFPSIRFGLEAAIIDLHTEGAHILFLNDFTLGKKGIPINGLIWMGNKHFMKEQIEYKLKDGFRCLKMKIGALHFETELEILKTIRQTYSKDHLELRVDANGAFIPKDALFKLEQLAKLDIHSIEQPIKAGNWEHMTFLCQHTPLPIALDEELIGLHKKHDRIALLDTVKPQYIILKPSLVGGFKSSEEWINMSNERKIGWWVTSALESNVGLNAIAQWVASLNTHTYQGLGTGQIYNNNIDSPLFLEGENLFFDKNKSWQKIAFV